MIRNLHKGRMGTVEFDAQFPGMRKTQDFIVYPIKSESESEITIQSDTRIGRITLAEGKVYMSKPHSSGAYFHHLSMEAQGVALCKLSAEELLMLKGQLFSTASGEAGKKENGIIHCDNAGAAGVFDHKAHWSKP